MKKITEKALHDQSYSDFDCFILSEVNQKKVLNKISAFGDKELLKSFQKMFEASNEEEADSYLTGADIVGVEQISMMTVCPEFNLQKDILQHSPKEAQVLLVSKFRLDRQNERFMLRFCSEEVILAYFECHQLDDPAQDYLVRHALENDYYKRLLFAYGAKQSLNSSRVIPLIKKQEDAFLKAYVVNNPLGYRAIYWCSRNGKWDYIQQFIHHPLDKLIVTLFHRKSANTNRNDNYELVCDVQTELKQLTGRERMCFAAPLSPEEENCLVKLPNTHLLYCYVQRYILSAANEKELLYCQNKIILEYYFKRHGLRYSSFVEILKNDWLEMFLLYKRVRSISVFNYVSSDFLGKKIRKYLQSNKEVAGH